jgi:hypothetical protein
MVEGMVVGGGRLGCVAGVRTFSNVVRAAILEKLVIMVSRSCKHGRY